MANLSDLAQSQFFKGLIYGDSGAGKTCFISKAPGPIYVMDFDNKISSLASFLKAKNPDKLKEINYEAFVANPKDQLRPIQRMEASLERLEYALKSGTNQTKTIVLDSLTTFAEELLREIMKRNPGIKRGIDGVPSIQDYQLLGIEFRKVLGKLLAMDLNVVVIAHMQTTRDETTGAIRGGPLLPGKLAESLPVVFPEIYRAFIELKEGNAIHALQVRPDGRHIVRTQIPGLPKVIPTDMELVLKELHK